MTYAYRGDRLTDPVLVGASCEAVRRADGKCVTGRSAMLVLFDGESTPRVVLRRQLRKAKDAAMTRPTMEELRAQVAAQHDRAHWSRRYAAEPGTGPAGATCHSCAFLRYTGHAKEHPKCGRTKYTHGDATTILTRSPACRLYEPNEGETP